jgi:hypothetical protein
VPTVRRPYAADDCLCPLIDVNVLDADMLVIAVPEATERVNVLDADMLVTAVSEATERLHLP